jgi:hypothetical protein
MDGLSDQGRPGYGMQCYSSGVALWVELPGPAHAGVAGAQRRRKSAPRQSAAGAQSREQRLDSGGLKLLDRSLPRRPHGSDPGQRGGAKDMSRCLQVAAQPIQRSMDQQGRIRVVQLLPAGPAAVAGHGAVSAGAT